MFPTRKAATLIPSANVKSLSENGADSLKANRSRWISCLAGERRTRCRTHCCTPCCSPCRTGTQCGVRRVRCDVPEKRKGIAVVLYAIFASVMFVLIGFTLELARVRYVNNQLQSAADAGALAGSARLRLTSGDLESTMFSLYGEGSEYVRPTVKAVIAANRAAQLGPKAQQKLAVEDNFENIADGDIVLGQYSLATNFQPNEISPDSVKVTVRFKESHPNNRLPLFFGSILKLNFINLKASAIAKVERPTLLPFVVYQPQWDALAAGFGDDDFMIDASTNSVTEGSDGNPEMRVFPNEWDGLDMPPGNFGWYDLGSGSTTSDLLRQIDHGPNDSDMAHFGGAIETGDFVSGVTGLRTATEVAFVGGTASDGVVYEGIIGKPRLIALYDYATGDGTNANFQITKFVLARIMYADLSGKGGGIVIQPILPVEDPHRVRIVK